MNMNLPSVHTFNDLYTNSKKIVDDRKKELLIIGNEYTDTRKLSANELKLFVERDIYVSIRNDELPNLNFEIEAKNSNKDVGTFNVLISDVEGEVLDYEFIRAIRDENPAALLDDDFLTQNYGSFYSSLGLSIQYSIAKLFNAYNRQEFRFIDGRFLSFGERLNFSIRFSDEYLVELLEAKFPLDEKVEELYLDETQALNDEVFMPPRELEKISDQNEYKEYLKKISC